MVPSLIVSLACAQLVLSPPAALEPLRFGDPTPVPFRPTTAAGAIAFKPDGGLAVLTLDSRREDGRPFGTTAHDLWFASVVAGAPASVEETGRLLVRARAQAPIAFPGLAYNGDARAIVFVEQAAAPSALAVVGREGDTAALTNPLVLQTAAGLGEVAVARAGAGFIFAWTVTGEVRWRTSQGATGVVAVAPNATTLSRLRVLGQPDGGATFAVQSSVTNSAVMFDWTHARTGGDAGVRVEEPGQVLGLAAPFGGGLLYYAADAGSGAQLRRREFSGLSVLVTMLPSGASVAVVGSYLGATGLDLQAPATGLLGFLDPVSNQLSVPGSALQVVAGAAMGDRAAFLHAGATMRVSAFTNSAAVTPLDTPLSIAAPAQREPSVVWERDAGAFVVGWEEREPTGEWKVRLAFVQRDGGVSAPIAIGLSQGSTHLPRLVGFPDGTTWLEHLPTPSTWALTGLTADGGLTLAGTGWRAVAGLPLLAMRPSSLFQTELRDALGTSAMLNATRPACAIMKAGRYVMQGWSSSASMVRYEFTPFDLAMSNFNPTTFAASQAPTPPGGVCLIELPDQTIGGAWRELTTGASIVMSLDGQRAEVVTTSSADPMVAAVAGGLLTVWENAPRFVGAAFVKAPAAATTPLQLALNAIPDFVRQPAVAGAPDGTGLVVWQEFDEETGIGSTRLGARLVFPDGTTSRDGGPDAGPDGGSIDAGLQDAGPVPDGGEPPDAGTPDAGDDAGSATDAGVTSDAGPDADAGVVPDAGARPSDGGAPALADTGPAMTVLLPVSCGCQGAGGLEWLALAVIMTLRARTRARRR